MWNFRIISKGASRLRGAWPYIVAFTIVAVLIVYAILRDEGDDNDPISDPASPPPPPAASTMNTSAAHPPAGTNAQATPKTPSTAPPRPAGSQVIAWIDVYSPAGGATSVTEELFAALRDGACQEVLDEVNGGTARDILDKNQLAAYRGAASACLAAFNHRPELWANAASAATEVAGHKSLAECLDIGAYQLLRRLIDAHRAEPTARFVRGGRGSAARPPCPRILSLNPAHGPASGGYRIQVLGEYLPNPAVIYFDEHRETVATHDNRAIVTVPPKNPLYDEATVSVDGWPFMGGSPLFTYDRESPARASSSASPSVVPTTTDSPTPTGNGP